MAKDRAQIYIVGGGIAGLSAAVFAIRDGGIAGKNVHILEELEDDPAARCEAHK